MSGYTRTHIHVCWPEFDDVSFPITFLPDALRQGCSLKQEIPNSTRLAGWGALGSPNTGVHHNPQLYHVGSGHLNSDLHAKYFGD